MVKIAAFPQECMLSDRKSANESFNFSSMNDALRGEFAFGFPIASEKLADGVQQFNNKNYKKDLPIK